MAEKVYKDFTGMKKSAVKTEVRRMLMEDFATFLSEKYTKTAKIDTAELAVVMGNWTDEDGFNHEVVGVAKAIAKAFYDSVGDKGRETEQYILEDEVQAYEDRLKEKAAKRKSKTKEEVET